MTTEDPKNIAPAEEQLSPPAQPAAPEAATPQAYGQQAPQPYYATQPVYGQPVYGQPMYGQPAPPRGLSITSMVCGIVGLLLSFFLVGFLPALVAVIMGHIGIKKEPAGKGFAVAGLVTGYLAIAGALLFGLLVFASVMLPLLIIGSSGGSFA